MTIKIILVTDTRDNATIQRKIWKNFSFENVRQISDHQSLASIRLLRNRPGISHSKHMQSRPKPLVDSNRGNKSDGYKN